MAFSPWYSKAKPKVSDYNPLIHAPFYSKSPIDKSYMRTTNQDSFFHNSPDKSLRNRSNRSALGQIASRELGTQSLNAMRRYKTQQRDMITDPITGNSRRVFLPKIELESLDLRTGKDRFPRNKSSAGYVNIQPISSNRDRISGALRKEVTGVSYVNPYLLKSSTSFKRV